jgi:hypothetical protein
VLSYELRVGCCAYLSCVDMFLLSQHHVHIFWESESHYGIRYCNVVHDLVLLYLLLRMSVDDLPKWLCGYDDCHIVAVTWSGCPD